MFPVIHFQFLRKYFAISFLTKTILKSKRSLFFYQSVYRYNTVVENMSESSEERIVWIDLEMTGLDLHKDRIIEMACIITDKNLNVIAKTPSLIIKQPDSLLDSMNDWCKEHHGKSGLTDAVKKSELTEVDAENQMLEFVQKYTPKSTCPLAGNSVHADKMFLDKYMPKFMKHLHYRIIDVSSIKELCRRWYPIAYHTAPCKALTHRALDDIQESIQELKYYRKAIFTSN